MSVRISPLIWFSELYGNYNPFFIYSGKIPLLHQTEVVARALFVRPIRILLGDVIGLGKTITALRILKTLENYKNLSRVLIAVPSVLLDQWINEAKAMGISLKVIERESLDYYKSMSELPSGWYIGSIDTLKRYEYLDILAKNKWDAIVVDEAHKLGYIGREPNDRWKNLGKEIIKNKEAILLLLSATPHRGKANDYLARLALIDPSLLEVTNVGLLERVFDKREFYAKTHYMILHRRSKDDINKLYEEKEIFKPCIMTAVLIEPNDIEKELLRIITELATTYLSNYYGRMLIDFSWETGRAQSLVALLRTVLIKRGLSSPQSLFKTFSKLIERRGKIKEYIKEGYSFEEAKKKVAEELEKYDKELDELLSGDIGEHDEELDDEFNKIAGYLTDFLDNGFRNKLSKAKEDVLYLLKEEVKDSKLETLKKILEIVLKRDASKLPEDFRDLPSGKVIVFTEFKDTAMYIYKRLSEWVEKEFGDRNIIRLFTSDKRGEINEVKEWLSGSGRKILITTDVAGEGLNLQYANVLINYEITWSPIRLEQRIGRVWRYGQEKTTYVFNLFLADALEKTVAEVVFSKLYGITISIGKLDPIMGEKVLYSTIRSELFEHAVEETIPVGGLIPIEIEVGDKKLTLSEKKIIELVTKDAKVFVDTFIIALKKLLKEIKEKSIYPYPQKSEEIHRQLKYLTGFANTVEAIEVAKTIVKTFAELKNYKIEEKNNIILIRTPEDKIYDIRFENPETALREFLKYSKTSEQVKYFVFKSNDKEFLLLVEASVYLGDELRYKEPLGILVTEPFNKLVILRGLELIKKVSEVLKQSIPVDEVFGLDEISSLIPQIIKVSPNKYYEEAINKGGLEIIKRLKEYEEFKKKERGKRFFYIEDPVVKINEPLFIFISTAFLPETMEKESEEVWGWAEEEAMPIVFNYEGLNGRIATRLSQREHYDVLSEKRDKDNRIIEQRFIEIKTKMGRSLAVSLKREEANVASEKGDKYWLYLVYGVKTPHPVILAIKDPLNRLPFQRQVFKIEEESYVFKI